MPVSDAKPSGWIETPPDPSHDSSLSLAATLFDRNTGWALIGHIHLCMITFRCD